MPSDLSLYDDAFYDTYGHEAAKMAPWFMPLLREVIPFRTLVDVGAGEGHYVKWCLDNGVNAYGIEGSKAALERSMKLSPFSVVYFDLREPYRHIDGERIDVALSLEVAEHIDPEFAGVFVDNLCGLSNTIVMTAAPPGQGGLEHVNEKPRTYWEDLFAKRGFYPDTSALLRLLDGISVAGNDGAYVTPWLVPNLMVFKRSA